MSVELRGIVCPDVGLYAMDDLLGPTAIGRDVGGLEVQGGKVERDLDVVFGAFLGALDGLVSSLWFPFYDRWTELEALRQFCLLA